MAITQRRRVGDKSYDNSICRRVGGDDLGFSRSSDIRCDIHKYDEAIIERQGQRKTRTAFTCDQDMAGTWRLDYERGGVDLSINGQRE